MALTWAVVREAGNTVADVLLLFDDRSEAEQVVWELRRRDQRVEVRAYREGIGLGGGTVPTPG